MSKMKETLEKLNPIIIEKLNQFFSETFLVDSSEINYGHSTRFGILFEAMWGYYMKEELKSLGYMVKWICRNQYNDFYISDLLGNFICNIEVKTLCLDSDESKSHFDALQSELLDTDLLFVSAWKWGELKFSKEGALPFYKKERSVSFEEYVLLTTDLEYRKDNENLWSEYDEYHTLPQFEFFPNLNGGHYFGDKITSKFTCDFIGRFENLHKDFNTVCSNIGIKQFKLPHAYNSKTFKESFNWTSELKEKVYNYYKKDFEFFNYES